MPELSEASALKFTVAYSLPRSGVTRILDGQVTDGGTESVTVTEKEHDVDRVN